MDNIMNLQLITVVVNYGTGSKVFKKAKRCGINNGTIITGKGTVKKSLLSFIPMYDRRKEIVLIITDDERKSLLMNMLNKEMKLEKVNNGIAFTTYIGKAISFGCNVQGEGKEKGKCDNMYKNIITIVNRGRAEDIMDAARKAGAKGGTIIKARGADGDEIIKVFKMDIEPEKEMITIVVESNIAEGVLAAIRKEIESEEKCKGIVFVQDIIEAYGLVK